MNRPAGRVRRVSKTRGPSRVGSRGVRNLTGRVASDREVFKSHGPGRVTLTRSDLQAVTRPAKSPVNNGFYTFTPKMVRK